MRLRIDQDLCTGHGRCYVLAPGLFTDDDRGYGQLIADGAVAPGQEAEAERAVQGCPEHAILVEQT